jgi:membrane protein
MSEIVLQQARPGPGQIALRVWRRMRAGRVSLISAGCAFYATLALFPGLSVLLSLYGLMFNPVSIVPQLVLLHDVLPQETFVLISRRVHVLVSHQHGHLRLGVWIGVAVALWSASMGTKSLLSAIDHTHGGGDRGFLQFQLTGLAMTLGATLAAVMALAFLVALPGSLRSAGIPAPMQGLVHVLSLCVLALFVGSSIAALFRFGPSPRPGPQPRVLPGALAATALWFAASVGFSFYVGAIGSFDVTYGPIAAIAGVMLWFWVSSYVVLLGAELNAALSQIPSR